MIRLSRFFTRIMHNYLPDAYIFVIILTLISFVAAFTFTDAGFITLVEGWGQGISNILPFAMQMILILVTGHVLALSAPIKKVLKKITRLANTPSQAVFIVAFTAAIASWINWGFGLVVGGLLALEMAKLHRAHFALLVAAAYSGFAIFGMGLSSSIALAVATAGNTANYVEQIFGYALPVSQTIFTWWNIAPSIFLAITMPIIMYLLHPKKEDTIALDLSNFEKDPLEDTKLNSVENDEKVFSDRMENSSILNIIFFALGFVYIVNHFMKNGFDLSINVVILIFLFTGILLHGTPINYVNAIGVAIKGTSGIVLQFPLYGGIQGIMSVGFATVISSFFVNVSTEHSFYLLQFLAAGLINFFVPSAGGQWIAQGLITVQAAFELGLEPAKAAMAVAWGDQWTNMAQPFWALPLLGMAGLKAKDIMGYTIMILIWSGIVLGAMSIIIAFI